MMAFLFTIERAWADSLTCKLHNGMYRLPSLKKVQNFSLKFHKYTYSIPLLCFFAQQAYFSLSHSPLKLSRASGSGGSGGGTQQAQP